MHICSTCLMIDKRTAAAVVCRVCDDYFCAVCAMGHAKLFDNPQFVELEKLPEENKLK
jgi:hypothetical protein